MLKGFCSVAFTVTLLTKMLLALLCSSDSLGEPVESTDT